MLTTGFWLLATRKAARFCNWLRIPPVRHQPAGLVQASGRRQMIAVLQDGCAVVRRQSRTAAPLGVHSRSQATGRSPSILNRLPNDELGEEP